MNKSVIKTGLFGGVASTIFAVVIIILFAFIIELFSLPTSIVKPVDLFIKIFSAFLGCFFFAREEKGLIKGLLIGLIYVVLSFSLFSIFLGKSLFDLKFLLDLLLGLLCGAVFGALTVNIKTR